VRKKDRIKPNELMEYLASIISLSSRVSNIKPMIGSITEKILKWKKSIGDLD
jgi:hypothetical protein